jgi:hypothetical protein
MAAAQQGRERDQASRDVIPHGLLLPSQLQRSVR